MYIRKYRTGSRWCGGGSNNIWSVWWLKNFLITDYDYAISRFLCAQIVHCCGKEKGIRAYALRFMHLRGFARCIGSVYTYIYTIVFLYSSICDVHEGGNDL